ncbi:hypothetical protein BRC66_04555 [Halobacteriales archaeon QH_2_66_30]|nr:MAG: hypothetical protein BRC66_04555 [Halobacteriales archaeon QH_2_66_30]
MSTTGRSEADAPAASDVASRLESAAFVRLLAARTAGGVAAVGLLAGALDDCGVPYQTSVVGFPAAAANGTDADVTLALGRPAETGQTAIGAGGDPAATAAYDVAAELGSPDPVLALAGTIGSGRQPGSDLLGDVTERGVERRPGIAAPAVDPADALAYSTLVHAPFSGNREAAAETLGGLEVPEPLDADARKQVASAVALAVAGDRSATERGTHAVERFLHPLAGGPFGTVGGFGDVLAATARERPGLATMLALGGGDTETALSVWRDHGTRAHEAVREAATGRYDGLSVARATATDGAVPVCTVARLLRAYRSPEPVVLVVADGVAEARAASVGSTLPDDAAGIGRAMATAAAQVGGNGAGTATRGRATYDCSPTEFVAAFREVVQ